MIFFHNLKSEKRALYSVYPNKPRAFHRQRDWLGKLQSESSGSSNVRHSTGCTSFASVFGAVNK